MGDALHVAGVTSAQEARLDQAGLLAVQGPTELHARTGVLTGVGTLALLTGTAATAPMTVAIAAHHWLTSRSAASGPYLGALEAGTTVTLAAAPGSNSRIDVVYVKQLDSTAGIPSPDATIEPVYGVVTGSPAAVPTKPALPVGAEELGTVLVAAGATSTAGAGVTITNTARQTVARGGVVPVRNVAERNALTQYPGLVVYRIDTDSLERTNGTTWRSVSNPRVQYTQSKFAAGIPSGTSTGMGPPPAADGFGAGPNGPTVPTDGVYAVTAVVAFSAEVAGRSFIEITIPVGAAARSGLPGGEDRVSVSLAGIRMLAGQAFGCNVFQSSGALRDASVAWYVARVSD